MKTLLLSRITLLALFFSNFSILNAGGALDLAAGPEDPVLGFALSDEHSQDDIVAAAKGALNRREWKQIEVLDNVLTASLLHRRRDANLKIVVEGTYVRFYSDSWLLKKDGSRKKFEHPAGWLLNLEKDIHKALGEPWEKQ